MTSPVETRWLGQIPFAEALDIQKEISNARSAGNAPDTVLLLEHDPVYTIGRTRNRSSLGSESKLPHPVFEISRGGQATYHGPGQLVGYPIIDLTHYGRDLHRYLHCLEITLMKSCKKLNIKSTLREGFTGVWVENRKIASIGVGVRRWITMHGFAINVSKDISGFDSITPCGIEDVSMTSVESEFGKSISVLEFSEIVAPILTAELGALHSS
ncbi:MAG: lipoyl(octanoyl) transferase LipB [Verrucomicrobiota bacterium]